MTNYIDTERPVHQKYEALMAKEYNEMEDFKSDLQELIVEDPDYLDSYNTLYSLALSEEDYLGAEIMLNRAYDKALRLLDVDDHSGWSQKLQWKDATNRHIIRTLLNKSLDFWMGDQFAEAKDVLAFLNASNPKEGLGFDFYLLGVSHKKSYMDFINDFTDNGVPNEEGKAWFDRNTKAS